MDSKQLEKACKIYTRKYYQHVRQCIIEVSLRHEILGQVKIVFMGLLDKRFPSISTGPITGLSCTEGDKFLNQKQFFKYKF